MLTWRESRFFIDQIADRPRAVNGYVSSDWLFGIQKREGETITGAPATFFAVTHLGSGFAVGRCIFRTLEQAQLFCERIAPLSDWQFDGPMKDAPWWPELRRRVLEEAEAADGFFGPLYELPWHDGDEAEQ